MNRRKMILILTALCVAAVFVLGACGGPRVINTEPSSTGAPLYGNALAQTIAGEGIVMLKNDADTLPLQQSENKLAVFGWGATDGGFILAGTGSGGGSGSGVVRLRGALETNESDAQTAYPNAGPFGWKFDCFGELFNIGTNFQAGRVSVGIDNTSQTDLQNMFRLYEPAISGEVMGRARDYADVAVMVISRLGGENKDLPLWQHKKNQTGSGNTTDNTRHYLEITPEEDALMKQINAAGFSKVILLVNTCNSMELGFIKDPAYGIDAVLSVGALGQTGSYAIRRILNGTIEPSGKTVGTWVYNAEDEPSFNNGGTKGVRAYTSGGSNFIEYREDIYVGYRYFETAAADGEIAYNDVVQYPFGFGLSYTTFDWTVKSISPEPGTKITADTKFKIGVSVKNTGSKPGMDVAQIYVTAPYTSGGIEKPQVVLAAFAKTVKLYPESQANSEQSRYNEELIYLEFDAYDFASYDCYDQNNNNFMGYELDAGSYEIKLQTDSHTLKTTKGLSTNGKISYGCDGVRFDKNTTAKDLNGNDRTFAYAQNYFTNVSGKAGVAGADSANKFNYGIPLDGSSGTNETYGTGGGATSTQIPMMSRTNLTLPAQAAQRARNYTIYTGGSEKPGWNVPVTGARPTTGAQNGLLLSQGGRLTGTGRKLGANFDDQDWDYLLDQMTPDQMWDIVRDGNYYTFAVASVGKPKLFDLDGPSGYSDWANGDAIPAHIKNTWTSYPVETVIGQTWSRKLAYNFGIGVGKEGYDTGVGGWYAPACNIHRNIFEGRNFEYFSEDPLLSGFMSADISYGARVHGVYTYVKHFALNETESNRGGLRTWVSEQALREIYLKPFEIAVKRGHATGLMNSFNFFGAIWTGGSVALQQNIVRGEWGFRGVICTDYFSGSGDWMNADQGLRAGTDLWIGSGTPTISDRTGDASLYLLRQSAKNILYAFANAWWYEETKDYDQTYFNSYFE